MIRIYYYPQGLEKTNMVPNLQAMSTILTPCHSQRQNRAKRFKLG